MIREPQPTHITANSSTLLDLIITDSPAYIIDSGTWPPVGDHYHSAVFCKFQIQYQPNYKFTRDIWKYDLCNFDELNEALLNAPWDILDLCNNLNDHVKGVNTFVI